MEGQQPIVRSTTTIIVTPTSTVIIATYVYVSYSCLLLPLAALKVSLLLMLTSTLTAMAMMMMMVVIMSITKLFYEHTTRHELWRPPNISQEQKCSRWLLRFARMYFYREAQQVELPIELQDAFLWPSIPIVVPSSDRNSPAYISCLTSYV